MTTLNNKLRDSIIDSIIDTGTTLPARKEALKHATEKRVRELCVQRVSQDFISATKNLPVEWFPHESSVNIDRMLNPIEISTNSEDELRKGWRGGTITFDPIKHPMSARFNRRDYSLHTVGCGKAEDPESWEAKLSDLIGEARQIRADEEKARRELRQFLHSVRTYKQIIEKAPELEPFLPDYEKPMPLTVPVAPLLSTLNKLGFTK